MQQYMIIERFAPDDLNKIYARLHDNGRGLPQGLHFVSSWLTASNDCVYQIMETDDESLFELWFEYWQDLVSFEMVTLRAKPENGG